MRWPSTATMVSPVFSPARAAGPSGDDGAQHRRHRRIQNSNPRPLQQLRRLGQVAALRGIRDVEVRRARAAIGTAHAQGRLAVGAHRIQQIEHHVALAGDRRAVDSLHLVARAQAGARGQ